MCALNLTRSPEIGKRRESQALAKTFLDSEKRVDELRRELALLKEHREVSFTIPPKAWIEERVALVQEVLERRTQKSALLLRQLLGKRVINGYSKYFSAEEISISRQKI